MNTVKIEDEPLLLKELVESLRQAEGASSQLIHQMGGDPRWIFLRSAINVATEGCLKVATFEARKSVAVRLV